MEAIIGYASSSSKMETRLSTGMGVTLTKEDTLELLSWLINMKKLPDETIDGVSCFHYQGEIDMDKYVAKYYRRPHRTVAGYGRRADVVPHGGTD